MLGRPLISFARTTAPLGRIKKLADQRLQVNLSIVHRPSRTKCDGRPRQALRAGRPSAADVLRPR